MKRLTGVLIIVLIGMLCAVSAAAASRQMSAEDQRALRARLAARYDIVGVTDGVALRPKSTMGDVRLIVISDGVIQINGTPVSGAELRERLGADADAVRRLSYLDERGLRALFDTRGGRDLDPQPPLESRDVAPAERDMGRHRSGGDRVRIFGDIMVREDEQISGQAVAVVGSVRIDGEVRDQVVAVLGSVTLGPKAVVEGDVVSVGGRVHRAEGSRIRGNVTEVAFADPNLHFNFTPLFDWTDFDLVDGFGAVPRLIGSTFRFGLLVLLASMALLFARRTVEASAQRVSDTPIQSTLVGIAAQILFLPVLLLTAVVLAMTVIGIPLIFVIVPFAVFLLLLLALAGFSGTVYAIGQWTRRRLGLGAGPAFLDALLGVGVVLLPVLVARLIALGGWVGAPIALLLLTIGFAIEYLVWSSGFGAVLANAFGRWQARRVSNVPAPPVGG
jgi:hypothetical protein